MLPAASLRHIACAIQRVSGGRGFKKIRLPLQWYAAVDRSNHCQAQPFAQNKQPLQDKPGIETVSFRDLQKIFGTCRDLISANVASLAGHEAPTQQDLQVRVHNH